MDIGRLLNVFSPGAGSTAPNEPPAAASESPPTNSRNVPISPERSRAFRDILSHYDLREISPRDFSNLVKKLQEAGAISPADVQELAQIRLELEQSGTDPNEEIDLAQFFQHKLQRQERDLRKLEAKQPGTAINREEALRGVLRQIDWVQKLASVDSRTRFETFDAVA